MMDRRSFLKAFGAALAGCQMATVADAAIPSALHIPRHGAEPRVPSIKVIGIGKTGLELMHSMQSGPNALAGYVQADYLSIRFNGRITRGIESPDLEWTVPLNYHRQHEVADDLHNVAWARQRIPNMEHELFAYVKDADIVLLVVGLDNAMSFAACDSVARIARESGALTIALVGVPYGQRCEDFPAESLRIVSHEAVNRLLHEADCVITTDGSWAGSQIELITWDWCFQSLVPQSLLSAVWMASNSGSLDSLRRVFSKSGRAVHGYGLGHSAHEAVKEAFGKGFQWFDSYDKTATAASGVVIVTGHPKLLNSMLNEVQAELARIEPMEIPLWSGKPEMLILVAPDDRIEVDGYFQVDIISTGIEFVGEL